MSDDETKVIFTVEAADNLTGLDGSDREAVIRRLADIAANDAPPSSFVDERIRNIDIIPVGGQTRLYTKVVDELPRGNTEYHVVFLLYIDATHDYPQARLTEYSVKAEQKLSRVTALETVADVERYLRDNDALGEADLRELLS